jgi:hypothetical protein
MNLRKPNHTECKEPGCGKPVQARGMCNSHYKRWHRSAPQCTVVEPTDKLILQAMPGTRAQIVERTGFTPQTVLKYLKKMRDQEKAHADNSVWPFVYRAGKGVDLPGTPQMRRDRINALQRKRYRAKVGRRPKATNFAALFAPLGI